MPNEVKNPTNRRDFLKQSGRFATVSALASGSFSQLQAADDNLIDIALVGCGGRGTGAAANALSTRGPTRLVAMADVFGQRLETSLNALSEEFADQVEVPMERRFTGFDAYRKAMDCLEGTAVVILATPPAFRPLHLECAVEKGCHVFMEKSFAVDVPGVRRVLAAGKKAADRNLKIAGGLMSRHSPPLEEAINRIHQGAIGEIITCWAYRVHEPVGLVPRQPDMSEMAFQVRNYSNFTWLNGSFILDWLIHNLDICCWVKGDWPVSAQGQGGRQARDAPDQLFDHFAVEYSFGDGTRLFAQGRHMENCWGFFGDVIHGATGSGVLGEGVRDPRLYRGHRPAQEAMIWGYSGPPVNPYQVEHDRLFDAIRNDTPYNETERCARANMVGILGRMAAESGKEVTWEQAWDSELVLAPHLEEYTLDSEPPVLPDRDGRYPVAMPGVTRSL